ncbi:hypothetical protein HYH03_011240 [Edaphochlamys debaryana]|uniref:Importin N-terminal domain-containing protein n=1 Tax=Edaphochlamys debaryana TaxID=47281 RepID=A0A836BWM1_9CHLO|nr:hypothetical protein HYH03_011240 [Edaphochlamys debaryana]|eukprot:KAG2490288.1 hypothetical protein HYH03_011240 [Edaphochlamys debaryana]
MSAAQIQVILSSPESFAGLIGNTLSQDNATRRNAEDVYGQLKTQRPDACCTNLLTLMRSSGDARVRATCALYLRKFFKSGPKSGWEHLNRTTKTLVKREMLAALAAEPDRSVAKQAADAVVELGTQLFDEPAAGAGKKRRGGGGQPQAGWPELLGSLQGWMQGTAGAVSEVTREAALQVVAGMAVHMRPWAAQLAPVVAACLASGQPAVAVAALHVVAEFLQVLSKPAELRPYQSALAGALAALQGALAAGNLEAAEQLLLGLIKTAECEPGLWQPHLRTAVPGMLGLAGPGPALPGGLALPEDHRKLAAEFVLTLTDIKPQMMMAELGAGPLASQLIACLAHFLSAGIEDEPGWGADAMAPPDMDEDETLGELHRHGLECATRAAEQLDAGCVLAAAVDMTRAWAADGDWRRRHAVLMCLSQVVGACKQVVGPGELASLASLLADALRDRHPRVRWAACHSAGVLADELGPGLQLQSGGGGAALLGALAELLGEPEGPACPQRVKAQACRALVGFFEGMDKEEEEAPAANPPSEGGAATPAAASPEAVAARRAAAAALAAPLLQPLAAPLLAAVDACAAGQGGAVAGGRALIPTPLQEYSLDVFCRMAVVLRGAFAPLFPAVMPRVLAVLARAAPFHGPAAVASGAVSEEEAAAIVRVQIGALECAAFMARAAGPAATAQHLPALAALLSQLARPDLEPSSPLLVPLINAMEPLAICMAPQQPGGPLGDAARQVLAPMLPLLASWAGRDVGLQLDDDSDDEAEEGDGDAELEDQESGDGAAGDADAGSEEDEERDDSDVTYASYGGKTYRYSATVSAAKGAAASALEELVDKLGPGLASLLPAISESLVPCLLDYVVDEVHPIARRAVPLLLRHYLSGLTHGLVPGGDPAGSPAAAQALLGRVWAAVTAVIHPEGLAAAAAAGAEGGAGAAAALGIGAPLLPGAPGGRPLPTASTRADMVQVLTSVVDAVEGSMLQQAWVAEAFAGLQAAIKAADLEVMAEALPSDPEDSEEEEMEGDRSEDLEGSEEAESEEEGGEEGSEGAEESPEAARERLRTQVEACVAAFTRKYGDAVAALAHQVLAAAGPEGQAGAVLAVRNGVVA